MEKTNQLEEFNFLKIIAMLTVVLQHSMALYSDWFRVPKINSEFYKFTNSYLSSYHVYMFVFISGYLYYYVRYELNKNEDNKTFIYKKYRRLIVPYICVYLLYVMPIRNFTEKSDLSINTVFNDMVLSKNSAHLWFLLMLFGVFIIFKIFEDKIQKGNTKALICLFYVSYIAGRFMEKNQTLNILQIPKILQFILLFYIGFIFMKNNKILINKIKESNIWVVLFVQILLISSIYLLRSSSETMVVKGVSVLIEPTISLIGIMLWYLVVIKMLKIMPNITNTKVYKFLKEKNFIIYLLHMPIIQIILSYLYNTNISPTLLVIICFVVSMSISSVLAVLINKFRITKIIFGVDNKKIFNKNEIVTTAQ